MKRVRSLYEPSSDTRPSDVDTLFKAMSLNQQKERSKELDEQFQDLVKETNSILLYLSNIEF